MPRQPAKKEEYVCCRCNKRFNSLSYFYKTYSKLYTNTEHLPVCKDCFVELFYLYADKYKDEKKAMQRICMAFDLYYADYAFDGCCQDGKVAIGNYMRLLNMVQCQDKTFDTTIEEGYDPKKELIKRQPEKQPKPSAKQVSGFSQNNVVPQIEEPQISEADIKRWGNGFDVEDYDMLNSHYNYLKDGNPNSDGNQEIFIKDLCYNNMLKMKALRDGRIEDYNKLSESYRKTFNQSGLKTVKETAGIDDFDLGVTIEMIEKYTPAEYYKNRELYKDFDKIGEYIQRFLYRPLKNLMHGTTERDYEFYVKDNDKVSGVDSDE